MKIKNILIYLIFAFVMILPFSVNAETEIRTEKFYLLPNNEFSASTIEQLKSVIYYNLSKLYFDTQGCTVSDTMDSCFENFDIFIDYENSSKTFNVYYMKARKTRSLYLNNKGIYFDFDKSITNYYGLLKIDSSDLSLIARTNFNIQDPLSNVSDYYNILLNSDKVCFEDVHNNCTNTGILANKYRDMDFWRMHKYVENNKINYNNFDGLYVYSPIVWSNIDFVWNTTTYFESLDNKNFSVYEPFRYNFDLEEDKTKIEITKTILVDASMYDKYELSFELIDNRSKCNSVSLLGICFDKDFLDSYVINVYNKSITNVKYYLSSDKKSWDNAKFNSFATDEYISYHDIDWNGKYGKYVFDLTNVNDYVLITISYNKNHVAFKTPELQIPEENMIDVDVTGKYAVGLIPKKVGNPVPFYYKGHFVSYYSFDNFSKGYELKLLKSEDSFIRHTIDFSDYNLSNPIFYIMNLNYSKGTTSFIKYSEEYFDLIYFENEYNSVVYNDIIYSPPSSSTNIESGNISENESSDLISNGNGIDLSLTSLVSKLPDLISGLGNAFTALGECIVIAFSSLPELVQSVLYISLIVTVILIAIKLIK